MNIIAVDIGNTNIDIGLFLDDKEEFVKSIPGGSRTKLTNCLKSAWQKIPIIESSKEDKHNGVIVVSSVKPAWTKVIREIAETNFDEEIYIIGKDIPLPMQLWVDEPDKVGTDRVVSAAAAYDVAEDARQGIKRLYRPITQYQNHQAQSSVRQEHGRRHKLRLVLFHRGRIAGSNPALR